MKLIYKKYVMMVVSIWGGFFPVFLALYFLLLAPQKATLKSLEVQLAEKKVEYLNAEEAVTEEAKSKRSRRIAELSRRLSNFVADFGRLDSLTFSISKIAKAMQVGEFSSEESTRESFTKIANCKYIGQTGTTIRFAGGFNKFAAIVNALERHKPVIFVDKFTISRMRIDDPEPDVKMQLTVFVRKSQQAEIDAGSIGSTSRVTSGSSSALSAGVLK